MTAETRLDVAARMCLVPEGAVVEGAVMMVSYLTPSGKHSMQYLLLGNMSVAQAVGMMEIAKNDILHR